MTTLNRYPEPPRYSELDAGSHPLCRLQYQPAIATNLRYSYLLLTVFNLLLHADLLLKKQIPKLTPH